MQGVRRKVSSQTPPLDKVFPTMYSVQFKAEKHPSCCAGRGQEEGFNPAAVNPMVTMRETTAAVLGSVHTGVA